MTTYEVTEKQHLVVEPYALKWLTADSRQAKVARPTEFSHQMSDKYNTQDQLHLFKPYSYISSV